MTGSSLSQPFAAMCAPCREVGFTPPQRSARGCVFSFNLLSGTHSTRSDVLTPSSELLSPGRPASKGNAKGAMHGRHDRTGDSFEVWGCRTNDWPGSSCPYALRSKASKFARSGRGDPPRTISFLSPLALCTERQPEFPTTELNAGFACGVGFTAPGQLLSIADAVLHPQVHTPDLSTHSESRD